MDFSRLTDPEAYKQALAGLLRKGTEVGEYIDQAPTKVGQSIMDAGQRQSALMDKAFDPTGNTLIRDPNAANQAAMNLFEGPMSFAPAGITAFHGTPHLIKDKFDINKVGTGEGAQAYGHGMYFAENPSVAEGYKTALSNVEMSAKGKPLTTFGVDERVTTHSPSIFKNPLDYGLAEYNKSLKTQLLDYPELRNNPDFAKELFDQRVEFLKSWGKGSQEAQAGEAMENFAKANGYPDVNMGGNLYKVDIPDAYIPNMLNWDLPISQQSAKVQELAKQLDPNLLADTPHLIVRGQPRHWTEVVDNIEDLQNPKVIKLLKKIYGEGSEVMPYGDYLASQMTGEQLYRNLSNPTQWSKEAAPYAMKAGMEDAAVSARLNELGIKGIRYKDAMSRGADEGTSNFVVFDPTDVKMLELNNQPITRKELIQEQIDKIAK
jgi:hypothetical protein